MRSPTTLVLMIMFVVTSIVSASEIGKEPQLIPGLTTAIIERTLIYQGILKDGSGNPVPDDTYDFTFRIYKQPSGGSAIWTSSLMPVVTTGGTFSTEIGPINLPFDTTYFLSIQISPDPEMTQRQKMTMMPYTAVADTANYAFSGPDLCWSLSGNVIYTNGYWGIAKNASNSLYGIHSTTHINLGVACTTGTGGQDYAFCTVGGGQVNRAYGENSTVSGGANNSAEGSCSYVGGGHDSHAGIDATVAGGAWNAAGDRSFVGGGGINTASGYSSAISGGDHNVASGLVAFVGGGELDTAGGDNSVVGGGYHNTAGGRMSFVGAGEQNHARGEYCSIPAGRNNSVSGNLSNISAGSYNTVSGSGSFIGSSGSCLIAGNDCADICGGQDTISAGSSYSAIISGIRSYIGGQSSLVGTGLYNRIESNYGIIGTGHNNLIGGSSSTIISGAYNLVDGSSSMILRGSYDTLTSDADQCLVYGSYIRLNNPYRAVLFGPASPGRLGINRDDYNGIDYPIHVGTNSSNGNGAYLSPGGVWSPGSSATFKENFTPFNGAKLLQKICTLSVTTYNYKNSTEKHIGPTAEEFVSAFDVGVIRESDGKRDDQYLAASDVAGVALAGVQELIKIVEIQNTRIEELEMEVKELKNR